MRLADIAPGATVTVTLPRRHARPAVVHDVYQDGKVGVRFTDTVSGITSPNLSGYYAATVAARYVTPRGAE